MSAQIRWVVVIVSPAGLRTSSRVTWLVPEGEGLPRWLSSKEPACQYRRHGFDPWVGKISWRGKWQPLQYSCLGNAMNRGAWWATVCEVTDLDTDEKLNPKQQPEVDKFCFLIFFSWSPNGSAGKESTCNAGDTGDTSSIPGLGRSPGEGSGYPLLYSCLKNPMDEGAWQATVHGLQSQTRLSN